MVMKRPNKIKALMLVLIFISTAMFLMANAQAKKPWPGTQTQ